MARVEYFGELRALIDCSAEEVEVANLRALLVWIHTRHGNAAWKLAQTCTVVVNGKNYIFCRRQERMLHTDTKIQLFPPVAGG